MHTMSSDYITGVAVLDEQHEQLFRLLQQSETLLKNENMLYKYEDLQKILKGLRDYTLSHFATEEAYMADAAYPQLEAHHQLHLCFIEKLNQMESAVANISLRTQDHILSELGEYLTQWMLQHILEIDKKMIHEIEAAK